MKRFLSLLVMVMVLLTSTTLAQAESLRERLDAPATYQTEASSPSGKTHVLVDATVDVPDVDAVPIYEVYSRYFEPEELADLCWYLFGDQYTYTHSSSGGGYTTRPTASGMTFYLLRAEGWNPIHYRFQQGREGKPCSVDASCMELDAFPFAYESTTLSYYADPGYNMGSAYPAAEDALAMANELVARLYPEFQFQHLGGEPMGYTFVGTRNGRVIGGKELYDTGYRVYYARMVDGIPLAQVDNVAQEYQVASAHSSAAARALPYESLFVDVGENGLYQFRYMNPVRLGAKLQADCTLLPFSQIMEIFRTIAPLSIAHYERNIEVSNEMRITRIALSYMGVPMRDAPTRYQLIPVWDFYGVQTADGGERFSMPHDSFLTINAMDGTIIDRAYGY